jgi:4-methylaminobutanoate oxidase (formaldehyde-forming)
MGIGYVPCKGESVPDLLASDYDIEIAGQRVRAEASLKPFHDPKSEPVKA